MSEAKYDLNFIALSLGLMPINQGEAYINPGSITAIDFSEGGHATIYTHGNGAYDMTPDDLAELEHTIRRRAQEGAVLQKEAYKNEILVRQEAINEISRGVQGAVITGAMPIPTNKKSRN